MKQLNFKCNQSSLASFNPPEHGSLRRHWAFGCHGLPRNDANWVVERALRKLVHGQKKWRHHRRLLRRGHVGKGTADFEVLANDVFDEALLPSREYCYYDLIPSAVHPFGAGRGNVDERTET